MEVLSESTEHSDVSDDEDLFNLQERAHHTLPGTYLRSERMRWHTATRDAAALPRDDVTLPLKAGSSTEVFTDVDSGVELPTWHCTFRNCTACSAGDNEEHTHEHGMGQHVSQSPAHNAALLKIAETQDLIDEHLEDRTDWVLFSLYASAVAEKAR